MMQGRPMKLDFLGIRTICPLCPQKICRIVQFLENIIRTVLTAASARYVQFPDSMDLHTVNYRHFCAFHICMAQD